MKEATRIVRLWMLIVLASAAMTRPSAAVTLDPLPVGFTDRLAQGWLPEICVRPNNPESPLPSLRDWARPRDGKRVRVLFICNMLDLSLVDAEGKVSDWYSIRSALGAVPHRGFGQGVRGVD
jgi:hypothetical protein